MSVQWRSHGRSCRRSVAALAVLWLAMAIAARAKAEPAVAAAFDNPIGIPDVSQLAPPAKDARGVTASLRILVLLTVLSLAPSILIMMTSFTRIVVVLALLRQAIGTQQLPPGQVLIGLAMIMTMLVMAPTWHEMKKEAVDPYLDGKLSQADAFERGAAPLRKFMFRQIESAGSEESVYTFHEYVSGPVAEGVELRHDDVGLAELVPAFVLSELKTSFVMGFRIYLPFLVIDMVIASILISMGMMMLPPVLVSLPFKLMLFVLADGWGLVVGSLLSSFGAA
ncbi:MAG TPA: flagellar type III secretion system pore protein FliP [Phycisphaerae bacterium]|nr:flagellar type III secretion system pore protein FliP [Phycisphaerae bacterium]